MRPGDEHDAERPEQQADPAKNAGAASQGKDLAGLGFQMAGAVFLFLFIGRWLDRHFGTSPWLTMIFVFVGAGAAFYNLYRKLMSAQKRDAERRARERR